MSGDEPDAQPEAPRDLRVDTEVRPDPDRPGHYTAELSDAWTFLTPSGGVLMSVGLRALEAELGDPSQRPLSATAVFCEPVRAGPLHLVTQVLRRGQAASQLRVQVQEGPGPRPDRGPGLEVIATFGRARPGPDVQGATFPAVARFEASELSGEKRYYARFFDNFEDRLALGHLRSQQDWSKGPGRYARWLRYLVPPRGPDGRLVPYALPPIADLMPPALLQLLGPEHPRFLAPSLDLTIHFLEESVSDRLLVHGYCRRARDGYATCEMEIWDEDRRLLGYATQVFMIRRWPELTP